MPIYSFIAQWTKISKGIIVSKRYNKIPTVSKHNCRMGVIKKY